MTDAEVRFNDFPSPDYDVILRDALLSDFEAWLIALQEQRVASFVAVAAACLVAVENNDVLTASKLFGQRAGWVKRRANVYALICEVFDEGNFLPQVPLSLYETAAKTNEPRHWLRMATDPGYRQDATGEDDGLNVWSARHLADMAGLSEGKTVSDVPQIEAGTEASVTEWEVGHVALDIAGWQPSGAKPKRVRMGKVVEILKGETGITLIEEIVLLVIGAVCIIALAVAMSAAGGLP